MELDAWDYELPEGRIATRPADPRDSSRLMVLRLGEDERVSEGRQGPENGRVPGDTVDGIFRDLPDLLREGDLLVVNDTRVWQARLFGTRRSGGGVELLVLQEGKEGVRALARPARKLRPGDEVALDGGGMARVVGHGAASGEVLLTFAEPLTRVLDRCGTVPLPPYLGRPADEKDKDQYQTVYAAEPGSAAAPTAGLHFTADLLARLAKAGIQQATVTLHVGIGTFRPLGREDLERGTLHRESWSVPFSTAQAIAQCRSRGGRVIAVGTTTVRTLESATPLGASSPEPGSGRTELFIRPPYTFRSVDGLITNFHLPKSSLLMLVASFCGRERMFTAYQAAIAKGYRFYSYGDAMLLLPG